MLRLYLSDHLRLVCVNRMFKCCSKRREYYTYFYILYIFVYSILIMVWRCVALRMSFWFQIQQRALALNDLQVRGNHFVAVLNGGQQLRVLA